jgi:hypothetical protein
LLGPDVERLDVQLRSVRARTVAAISGTVALDGVLEWYDGAMAELDAAVAGHTSGSSRRAGGTPTS